MKTVLKGNLFNLINKRTIIFIFIIALFYILFAIIHFSSNRIKFYKDATSAIKYFSFSQSSDVNLKSATTITKLIIFNNSVKTEDSSVTNFVEVNFKSQKKFIIPNNTIMSENQIFTETEDELNLPLVYWSQWRKLNKNKDSLKGNFKVCDIGLPSPHILKFNNIYWQEMVVNNSHKLYLYNAYYDNREQIKRVKIITESISQKSTDSLVLW